MTAGTPNFASRVKITWEKLPNDFILNEEPAPNFDQQLLGAALRESLEIAGLIVGDILIAPNIAICATLDDKLVVKTPDLFYATNVQPLPNNAMRRSYTPHLEGSIPDIIMEFLSSPNPVEEFSGKQTDSPGKFYFYRDIVQAPIYALFEIMTGLLEVYRLTSSAGMYILEKNNTSNRYWIEGMELFLGVWHGTKADRTGYWLRWWDKNGEMLLWGSEMVEKERKQREIAQQEAEQERSRSQILAAQLRAAGIEPEA